MTNGKRVLSTFDQILSLGAMVSLVGAIAYRLARPGQDPLCNVPSRSNRLREDALALAVFVYLTAALALSGVVRLSGKDSQGAFAILVVGSGAHIAGIGACLFVAASRFEGGIRRFCLGTGGVRPGRWTVLTMMIALVAIGLCPAVRDGTIRVILHFAPDHEFAPHATINALHDKTQPLGVVAALWVSAVVLAPVAEEFFFRGLVQTFLVGVLRNRWLAIALASLIFGAVHYPQPHAIGALVVLAMLIGFAYERTGSLLSPVLIHAAFNLKTLIWDALGGPHG